MRHRRKPPSLRLHKATGQAVVTLNGTDHYLGRHGTQASKSAYDRLIGQWLVGGRRLPEPENSQDSTNTGRSDRETIVVKEIVLAYLEHAETYYRGPDGNPTQELKNVKDALLPVREQYGNSPAVEFGPLALRAVREHMVVSGLARTTINARIHRIRRCFRWAVSVQKLPGTLIHELETVDALTRGRSAARETDPIEPVPIEDVHTTLPHLNRVVRAMVQIQLLTGCRAGEVMIMRGCDLTMGDPNWEYRPGHHKSSWRGKKRVIPLGPKAQNVLKPFLKSDLGAFLFDPKDVLADVEARRTGKKRRPKRTSYRYDRRTYRQAVIRACDRAFPHPVLSKIAKRKLTSEQHQELRDWKKRHRWCPLQLRHTHGTRVRAKYGLEGAQVTLATLEPT